MKILGIAFLGLIVLTGSLSMAYADEKKERLPLPAVFGETQLKKLEEAGAKAEQHQIFIKMLGTWSYELRYWPETDKEPALSTGEIIHEMFLDDRFLSSKTNVILNFPGQTRPYEGFGLLGYDTAGNVYETIWVDSWRTGMATGTATYDEKKQILEEKGRFTLMDKEQIYRAELEFINDNTHTKTIFLPDGSGKERKSVEIKFQRKI